MNSSVIVFPGSNCDRDIAVALKKMQFKNQMVWHKETKLPKSDLIVVPGGFSYGDYLRSGAIAGKSLIINEVLKELPDLDEWLNDDIKKKFNNIKWKDAILKIHSLETKEILKSKYYKRLVYDELFAHFLLSSKIRTKIKKIKKSQKIFKDCKEKLIQDLNF